MMIRKEIVAALLLAAAFLPGCIERKITFGSSPAGAVVTLNDEEVGRTPCSVPFTWYGDYDIKMRLSKNVGTEEKPEIKHYYLHTHERATAPWFQWVGVDLFTELLPIEFKDEKFWAFTVPELREPADKDLIERARQTKTMLETPEELQNKKKK
ncbi:MAG TPA: PEGA domain-containing protein [Phycisphaerae bacterium]|nr:PEGA domain-containing protein [Phycisphaerae bacterium]